jgi:hypothetical protein
MLLEKDFWQYLVYDAINLQCLYVTQIGNVFIWRESFRLRLKQPCIKGLVNLLHITLQRVPFCCYLGIHPNKANSPSVSKMHLKV